MSGENVKCLWMISPSRRISSGLQKRRRAAAEMELDDLAFRIQPRRHPRHFASQMIHIGHAWRHD